MEQLVQFAKISVVQDSQQDKVQQHVLLMDLHAHITELHVKQKLSLVLHTYLQHKQYVQDLFYQQEVYVDSLPLEQIVLIEFVNKLQHQLVQQYAKLT